MQISDKGINLIKQFEGCILQSYDDWNNKIIYGGDRVRGTLTIGYGHVEGVYRGQVITQQQADEMLRQDMIRYSNETQAVLDSINVPFEITQNVFDALVSFDYNLGSGCVKTLLANGTRDKQTVADMMLEYRNKGSQWETGLLRRRKAERELFLKNGNEGTVVQNNLIADLQAECNKQGFSNQVVDGIFGTNTLNGCPTLKQGARGNITKILQEKLVLLGYSTNGVDGIFGSGTQNAVVNFQRDNRLSADGIVGKNTWTALLNK